MKVLMPSFEKRSVVIRGTKDGTPFQRQVDNLVTVVVQDARTMQVLMLAYTDKAGYLETLRIGNAVYFSTSRNKRWMKGEESGDTQKVVAVTVDCDGDAIIYFVEQQGDGACHTKAASCFYRRAVGGQNLLPSPKAGVNEELLLVDTEVHERLQNRVFKG